MSKSNVRRVKAVCNVDAQTVGHDLEIEFRGRTTAGAAITVKVSMEWWMWEYAQREIHKAWTEERAARTRQITNIDKAFPTLAT